MNTNFAFNDKLIVRTPRLSQKDTEISLTQLLQDDSFLESVYIASPNLYNECLKLKQGDVLSKKEQEKVENSLMKYHYRMATRSTPFGLFSGCHVTRWTNEENGITISKKDIKRHTRIDMHYLCALSQKLSLKEGVIENIKFFSNNSVYVTGNELRYVEYTYQKESRSYQICAVQGNEYLDIILKEAKTGKQLDELVQLICSTDPEVAPNDVLGFLMELVHSQILISELEPCTTAEDFLDKIISVLQNIKSVDDELTALVIILNDIRDTLRKIDNNEYQTVEGYKYITSLVERIGFPFDESKLFHTDIYKKELAGGVSEKIKQKLTEAAELMNKITPYVENPNLKNFKENFYNRYEAAEMPLLKVLDTESGIGYLNSHSNKDITPLIDDIALPQKPQPNASINWNQLEQLLHKKTIGCTGNKIEIFDEDLKDFEGNWTNLPPSFPMMFRILSEDELFIESCGGSSAVNLLGRFAHGDAEINQISQEIADKEQEINDNILFAEVVHLPESRVSNILLHPAFRKYEIPYLSNATGNDVHTIDVSDLYVSIKNNKIVLRSKKLNKIIIPRLSNAHNYSHNALPVYQFLCDLQNQGKRGGLFFHWGGLGKIHQKFPRVTYKSTILSLAQWNIRQSDVLQIINADQASRAEHVQAFKEKWELPRYMVLAEGDNELFIDFESEKLVNVWIEYVKKRNGTVLKEFIPSTHGVAEEGSQEKFSNQVIALLQSTKPSYERLTIKENNDASIKRRFSLGSEWLYFKMYCGVRSADKILSEVIQPICEELEDAGMIEKWFFIRYNDPDFHLRVRFQLKDLSQLGQVIQIFNKFSDPFIENGLIWKMQNDTYDREIERYGSQTMEQVETIFSQDSAAVLKMISQMQQTENENFRWMWAIKSIDELFKAFNVSLDHKFEIIDSLRASFAQEFNANKLLKSQLDTKYRQHRDQMDKWLENEGLLAVDLNELQAIRILFERTIVMRPVAHNLSQISSMENAEVSLENLLSSLIHMIVNRVITSQPRLHEMIIYDFISRLYKSKIARKKISNSNQDVQKIPSL
ncbi:lantibiotic dehydratase [Pedobacter gandavensis]|uniref:lantibiotic dehydratase n=1 Tax=Pedobacter gandavensis TaxID=2679963 RepID=UPI00292E05DE|nr:lantibiotic dehydratase [Pedobacter gandavensis]